MGAKKAVGALVILLIVAAAAWSLAPPGLREKINAALERARSGTGEAGGAGSGSPQAGGGAEQSTSTSNTSTGGGPGEGAQSGEGATNTTSPGGSGENNSASTGGEALLEASASNVYYYYYDDKVYFIINITNKGSSPANITSVALTCPRRYYSTMLGILNSTPSLPLVLAPGESVTLNITTRYAIVQLDVYSQVQIEIETNTSDVVVINTTVVRPPNWRTGNWVSDLSILLPDLILHEAAGLPVPYNRTIGWGGVQTDYGPGSIYITIFNITGNLFETINTSWLINATTRLLSEGNVTSMTIDSISVNETQLYIAAHELVNGTYHQVEVEIIYHPDTNITTIKITLIEA